MLKNCRCSVVAALEAFVVAAVVVHASAVHASAQITQIADDVYVLIADLHEDASRVRQQLSRRDQSVAKVGQV